MKDNYEKILEQYQEKLTNMENERKTLEEQLACNESLANILQIECNEAKNKNKELSSENDILKEKYTNTESLLKVKDGELSAIKDQLDILWNQTHHLTNLSPLPNIISHIEDISKLKELDTNNKAFFKTISDKNSSREKKIDTREYLKCEKCKTLYKSTDTKQDTLATDAAKNKMSDLTCDATSNSFTFKTLGAESYTDLAGMNSNNSSIASNLYEVDNTSTSNGAAESINHGSNNDDIDLKNLERIRTILIAEITSLQLLHSMFDLTISSITKNDSKESVNVLSTNKPNMEDFTDKEVDRHSSSTPSGYETGSRRGSHVDIHCNDDDTITPDYMAYSDEEKTKNETFQLSSIIADQKTESLPSSVSLSDFNVHPVTIDKISILHKEIDNQRKTIDEELVKMSYQVMGGNMLNNVGRLRKRDLYHQLVQTLTDPILSSNFNIDQLEQILNLVLVDHSITGCLLTLSHRNKSDAEEMLLRLSSFESVAKSIVGHNSDDQEYYNYKNDVTEIDDVDNVIPYVDPGSLTAALTTMQVVNDNDVINREVNDLSSDSDSSPVHQKKGIQRFLCVSVRSMRRTKKQKASKKD